jgi:predicted nucleotidyltransferase
MRSLLASDLSASVVLALSQCPNGATLTDLAAATEARVSSVQRAVALLIASGVVTRQASPGPHYVVEDHRVAATYVDLAALVTPQQTLARTITTANRSIEFASLDDQGLLLVTSPDADRRALRALEALLVTADLPFTLLDHDELRERLLDEPALRQRALAGDLLRGRVERSFPDTTVHGDLDAPPLGRLHPSLRRPSSRSMASIAKRYGLTRVAVFGSAVRADLRPESDVDIVVQPKDGTVLGIKDQSTLRGELERLFDREVDLVNGRQMRPAIRKQAEREAVVLFGPP